VFDLLADEQPDFNEIERVRIAVAPQVYEAHARFRAPQGTFEALLSYHFTVASALRDRRFWLDSVHPEKMANPELQRFMRDRVQLFADPELSPERSRVDITLEGGRVITGRCEGAKGSPANRVHYPELRAKYERCVSGRMDQSDAAELFDLLVRIDDLDDLGRVFQLMRSGPVQRQ
jgi:2-methylcitrate dehydratase PrpD